MDNDEFMTGRGEDDEVGMVRTSPGEHTGTAEINEKKD